MRLLATAWTVASLAFLALPAAAAAGPSCAAGPETVGETIYGTPCADTIRLPRGVTTVYGEGGDDTLYGQRGNDRLYGGEGADRLYGGVGDDRLRGGPGDDLLAGGFGADSLDGEAGDDLDRGDATVDRIGDSGGGTDTLSFATGATPGFPNSGSFFTDAGFPPDAAGRGVYVDLGEGFANDGLAPSGGGVDEPLAPASDFGDFETVIGTAFPDYIVGTPDAETFYGGGGADLIDGGGGGDVAYGGAGGDGCLEVAASDCESGEAKIDRRDPVAIAVGSVTAATYPATALYLAGSDLADDVTVSFQPGSVTFSLQPGSAGAFDTDPAAAGGCEPPAAGQVVCPLSGTPDSIVLAGLEGEDTLSATGLPESVSVVLLGGEDDDRLTGGETEDALVDGAGDDVVAAGGGDDALPNNGGADRLDAGPGEDLFISNAVCDGDALDGGGDRDNANWANFGSPIAIDMEARIAGLLGPEGEPACPSGSPSTLTGVEDIEGTNYADSLRGDAGPNQILGRFGADSYRAGAGDDFLLANSGDSDPTIDCGEGFDTALIDFPTASYEDAAPLACEAVEEREPNSFRPPDTPPGPGPEPEPEPGPAPGPGAGPPPLGTAPAPSAVAPRPPRPRSVDRKPPKTRLLHRPSRRLFAPRHGRRRVAFAFSASEAGTFRCKLDRRRFRRCRSPRRYRLGPGRHAFRVFAVDAAGNRDRSPALVRVRVIRR